MRKGQVVLPFDKSPKEVTKGYARDAAIVFVVIGILYALLDSWLGVPYGFSSPWDSHGNVWDGVKAVWPLFIWAAAPAALLAILRIKQGTPRTHEPSEYFGRGSWLSFNAGFFEEIIYRWLMLFSAMIFLKVANIITLGLTKIISVNVLVPFANWASFGLLEAQFYGDYNWLFAGAIVLANVRFRRGHEYQGLFGALNAWYVGLVLFYVMFNYGLFAAIVVHVLYDLIIFWIRGVSARFQPEEVLLKLILGAIMRRP